MFQTIINPRFGDVDSLGHINNTVPAFWFEVVRGPLISMFDPSLKFKRETFPLIIAHTDFDFKSQMYFQYEVEVKAWISRIGTKSFTVYHEAWQQGKLGVKGSAVIVYYDFNIERSAPIPDDKRKLLAEHLLEPENAV